jgi:hypothetical protein
VIEFLRILPEIVRSIAKELPYYPGEWGNSFAFFAERAKKFKTLVLGSTLEFLRIP